MPWHTAMQKKSRKKSLIFNVYECRNIHIFQQLNNYSNPRKCIILEDCYNYLNELIKSGVVSLKIQFNADPLFLDVLNLGLLSSLRNRE